MKKIALSSCVALLLAQNAIAMPMITPQPAAGNMPVRTQVLRWVTHDDSQALPTDALVVSHDNNGPVYICQAKEHGGVHPGVLLKTHCVVTYGGKSIPHTNYKILAGNAKAVTWKDNNTLYSISYQFKSFIGAEPAGADYNYLSHAALPVIGGFEYAPAAPSNMRVMMNKIGGSKQPIQSKTEPKQPQYAPYPDPLYICRTMDGDGIRLGKVVKNQACNFSANNKEKSNKMFQVLYLNLGIAP